MRTFSNAVYFIKSYNIYHIVDIQTFTLNKEEQSIHVEREREREREREKDIERDRQTDRETAREREADRERQTHRQIGTER